MGAPITDVTEFIGNVVPLPGNWEIISQQSIINIPNKMVAGISTL